MLGKSTFSHNEGTAPGANLPISALRCGVVEDLPAWFKVLYEEIGVRKGTIHPGKHVPQTADKIELLNYGQFQGCSCCNSFRGLRTAMSNAVVCIVLSSLCLIPLYVSCFFNALAAYHLSGNVMNSALHMDRTHASNKKHLLLEEEDDRLLRISWVLFGMVLAFL